MRKLNKRNPNKVARRSPKRADDPYSELLRGVVSLIEQGRRAAVRSVNVVLTSTYWRVGQRIVEHEQSGAERAVYGESVLKRLAQDLTARLGRGFSERNIEQMRLFYLGWPKFPLPWSHYVRLLSVADPKAREYYQREALMGGWSVRQLDRQVASLAYQRTRGAKSSSSQEEVLPADAQIRDPFVLEFLNLKDEYGETDLESALIGSIEEFLLELGNEFTFVARQKRLRVGNEWYRVDLVLFHRRLQALIVVDLKLGKFTHADAGQMNLYLNYARENWCHAHENPPVGLILCSEKDAAVAHYALGNLENQVLAREYQLSLPHVTEIAARIDSTRRRLTPLRIGPPGKTRKRRK